jgi:hypothetical protein
MELEPILNGEDMESVREKINALIEAFNLAFPITKSYLDLEDKPKIDGIELLPETIMEQFTIPVESIPDTVNLQELFINAARNQAEIIARQVAIEEIQNANQIENIPPAQGFVNDDWEVLVFVPQNGRLVLHKTTMKDVTNKAVWAANKFEASIEPTTVIVEDE